MVSNARVDFPDPDLPQITINAPCGIDTVMSARLCSRAPWTMSSDMVVDDTERRISHNAPILSGLNVTHHGNVQVISPFNMNKP